MRSVTAEDENGGGGGGSGGASDHVGDKEAKNGEAYCRG